MRNDKIKEYYGDKYTETINFFMETDGCYVLCGEDTIVLAYRCNKDDWETIDLDGEDVYVQYASGNLEHLKHLCVNNIRYIVSHKRDRLRVYRASRLTKK